MLGAIAAAWWPGRMVARLPVVLALSGRPPKPRPARHAAIAAAALIATGIGCLALSDRDRPPLIVAGTVATIVGGLLLGPAAIRIFSGLAGRLSIGPRLALRDLVRHQARSGAALAAVTLALGIAATVVIVASAEQAKDAAEPPNLSDRQIRVYLGPAQVHEIVPPEALKQIDRLDASVTQLAARLDRAAVIELSAVLQRGQTPSVVGGSGTGARGFLPSFAARKYPGPSYRPGAQLFVATARGALLFGDRSRDGRSEHGLPRRPQRCVRTARHPERRGPALFPSDQRPEDRRRPAPVRLRRRDARAERRVHHARRPSPPRLDAAPGRLARSSRAGP